MPLIRKSEAPTFTTPNAVMVGHAGPSLGSADLSMWQVRMEPAAAGPAIWSTVTRCTWSRRAA